MEAALTRRAVSLIWKRDVKVKKQPLVELDNELRKILGTEVCKGDSKAGKGLFKGVKPESKSIEPSSQAVPPMCHCAAALSGDCLDTSPMCSQCHQADKSESLKLSNKQHAGNVEEEREEHEQYSPPNTRRLQAIKQQTYSFRRSKKDGEPPRGMHLSKSNEREREREKSMKRYRAHRSNSPKVKGSFDANKKRDLTPSSRSLHTDRSVSPACSVRSDSPCRAKSSKPICPQDKSVSGIETKLSLCCLSQDEKENQPVNRGVFAIRLYLNGGMRKTPRKRNKSIKVKGVPLVKQLDYTEIKMTCTEKCFVRLLREEGLCTNAAYIIQDDGEKETKPTFKLKKSVLEKVVKRFSSQIRNHLQCVQQDTRNQMNNEVKTEIKETEIKTQKFKLPRTRSYSNIAVGSKKNLGHADPNLPILERQKTSGENVEDEDEMPKLTCAFGGQ